MFKLLYKEFLLSAHPTLYIFMLLGTMVIIPSYPYSTVFLYGCLAPFITFSTSRENNDVLFTALLPINKREVVKGKCALFVFAQIGQMIISLPFAILRTVAVSGGNPVGIEANFAYYGLGLMIFSIFNFVFFTQFYKTAYKVGKAFAVSMIFVVIGMIATESLAHIETLSWIDSTEPEKLLMQLPILLAGIVIYVAGITAAYKIAAQRFEKVDL